MFWYHIALGQSSDLLQCFGTLILLALRQEQTIGQGTQRYLPLIVSVPDTCVWMANLALQPQLNDKASLQFFLHSSLHTFVHSFLFRNFRPCQHKTQLEYEKKLLPFLQIKHGRSFSSNSFDTEIHRLWPLKTNPVRLHCSARYLNKNSTGSATGDTSPMHPNTSWEGVWMSRQTVSWKNTFTGNLVVRCLGKVKHILPKLVIYHGRIPKNSPTKLT